MAALRTRFDCQKGPCCRAEGSCLPVAVLSVLLYRRLVPSVFGLISVCDPRSHKSFTWVLSCLHRMVAGRTFSCAFSEDGTDFFIQTLLSGELRHQCAARTHSSGRLQFSMQTCLPFPTSETYAALLGVSYCRFSLVFSFSITSKSAWQLRLFSVCLRVLSRSG